MAETKICKKCGEELPATTEYFYKAPKNKDGLIGECKKCYLARVSEYSKNSKVRKEYQKGYRENNKESIKKYKEVNREQHLEYQRKYSRLHKEKFYIKSKEYRLSHPEEVRLSARKWVKKNKDYTANAWQKRKSIGKNLPCDFSINQWVLIKKHFNNTCAYCGKELPLTREHFIPLSKGGEYTHNNIIPACKSCNSSKNNRDFFDWYPTYKHYSKSREKKILDFLNYKNGVQQLTMIG